MSDTSGNCERCKKLCESRCGSCRLVFYCSQEHQKKDWKKHRPNCSKKKYSIERNEKLGEYLAAAEDMDSDTLIFKDKPLIIGPKRGVSDLDDNTDPFCLNCCRTVDSKALLNPCSDCGLPICQTTCADQFYHKNFECRFIQEVKKQREESGLKVGVSVPAVTSSSDDTPSQAIDIPAISEKICQSLLYFRCILLKFFDKRRFGQLMLLESNGEHRENLASLEKTTKVFRQLTNVFSSLNHKTHKIIEKPDLHKIIGIIDTNSVDFKVSATSDVVGVYPLFAKLEHSCCPNTRFYFVPRPDKRYFELVCRSSVKIKKKQHISVTYVNILWNTEKRRDFLKKQKFFWCDCKRCSDPLELGSNFSTLICPVQGCDQWCIPALEPKTADGNAYWQCQNKTKKCGKICESWQIKKVDNRLSEIVKTVLPTAKNCKDLLSKIEELVHPDYYLNFVVNHNLIQLLGQDEATKNDSSVLDQKLKLCNRLIILIKKLDPGLAVLNVYAGIVFYEMHSAILAMIGGEGDEDYLILRKNPESVKLSKVYLQKCIQCFQYELLDLPETKMKILANKKLEYLNMLVK